VWSWISDGGVGTAATVATFVSTLVSLWFRFWDRPSVEWVLSGYFALSTSASDPERKAIAVMKLWNAGDGRAFRVRVKGVGCRAWLGVDAPPDASWTRLHLREPAAPLVSPGDGVECTVVLMQEEWGASEIEVTWETPPIRRSKVRSRTIRLMDAAAMPED